MFELLAIDASEMAEITFADFISTYGVTILWAIITAVASVLGAFVKKKYTQYVNDKTKKDVVTTVVMAVQQLYYNLEGPEKLQKALESASEMLAEKGITVTDLELRMLIESAVGSFKDAFKEEPVYEVEEDHSDFVLEESKGLFADLIMWIYYITILG